MTTTATIGPIRVGFLLVALAMLVGCSPARSQSAELRDSVHGYLNALRWGHIGKAASYIPVDRRAQFLERKRLAMAGVRMHEVEVRNVRFSPAGNRARVVVMLAFTRSNAPVVKRHLVEQRWRWHQRQWQLESRKRQQQSPSSSTKSGDLY